MAVTVTVSIMGGCIYGQKRERGGKPRDIFIKYQRGRKESYHSACTCAADEVKLAIDVANLVSC